jgi:RNA polymerase sigma factor (sigma-70 family)
MLTDSPLPQPSLLARLKSGDEAAFAQLYRDTSAMVFYRIKRLVHVHEVAEELTQDVYFQIWNKRTQLNEEIPFVAIVMQTAKSIAINYYQRALREEQLLAKLVEGATAYHDPIIDDQDFFETKELLETIIAKLPPQRQKVFRMCKLEGKSYEDTATELQVSVGTIKDHMAKAMRFIKAEFFSKKGDNPLYLILLYLFSK